MNKIIDILIRKYKLELTPTYDQLLHWSKKNIELLDVGYSSEVAGKYAANLVFPKLGLKPLDNEFTVDLIMKY